MEHDARRTRTAPEVADELGRLYADDLTERPWFREQERQPGPLGDAAGDGATSHLGGLLADVLGALYDGGVRDTAAPGQVVAFLDGATRLLHEVRQAAVGESRRRLDAAMKRSAELLGIDGDA